MKREKSCGTIIFDQGKVLLIGSKDENGELFWSFPKGHQELGETDVETAIRETLEEVGLNVEIINQTPVITSHPIHNGAAIKDIYLFLARAESGEVKPQAGEVETWRWVDFDEVNKYLADYYQEAWSKIENNQTGNVTLRRSG